MTSLTTRRRSLRAGLAAATAVASLAVAAPAMADYSGSVGSYPGWGATADYTVTRLSANSAEINGRIRDTRADGACAYVRAWVVIDWAVDPSSSATACGAGASAPFSVYTRDTAGLERIQSIKVQVCRRTSAGGALFDCNVRTLTQNTF